MPSEPEHPVDTLTARPRLVQPTMVASEREARLESALAELKGQLRTLLSDLKRPT